LLACYAALVLGTLLGVDEAAPRPMNLGDSGHVVLSDDGGEGVDE
jgi:hypothetical protein